jgi:tetratricopeptide (TPR) repeat protein
LFGTDDERVADGLVDFAWSLSEQRRYAEAETCLRDALVIYRKHNSDHQSIVRALWALQDLLLRQSRLVEAEQVANEALALTSDTKDSESAELPLILHNLANVKSNDGNHQEAEELARRAVEMHRRLHGDHHPETAWGLWVLGQSLIGQKKFPDAEPPLREALAIFREYYTSEFRAVRGITHDLASVLEAQGDRAGLDALFREQADQAIRSDMPSYHVRLAELLLSNNSNSSSDAQTDEAHRLIRHAIEEYSQVAIDYPHDFDRRVRAAAGLVELLRTCAANPDVANEADEVERRLSAELPQIVLDAKRLADPAASADAISVVALVRLRMGDESGYRAMCKTLVDLPDYPANEVIKSRTIFLACLAPDSMEDLNLLVTRAEAALVSIPKTYRHFSLTVLGAALYRAGQYEQAAQRLEESNAVYHSAPPLPDYDVTNHQRVLMAMTKWQLGQQGEARRLLAESQTAIENELHSPWTSWNRRASLQILRREAEALIEPNEADEAVENKSTNDE